MAENGCGAPAPKGGEDSSSRCSSPRPYQATVEDDPESDHEGSSCYSNSPSFVGDDDNATQRQPKSQDDPSRRPSVLRTANSYPSHHPRKSTAESPRSSRIRHENLHVHFSDREPPQTYSDKSSPSSESENIRPRQNSSRPRVSESCQQGRFKSAVDLRWGLLFSEDGLPTKRLTQLLGGIADHLISEQEPKNSLVITPKKLHAFYKAYPYKAELIPFLTLFRCNSSQDLKALESIYQEMKCQYHLVPEETDGVPNMPALTATGFVRWMVCCILADPEQEAYRLDKVVQTLPIETHQLVEVDGNGCVTERLPKQLSRHLLPAKPNEYTKEQLLQVCEMKLPTTQSPAPTQSGTTTPPCRSSFKRGREDCRDDTSRRYMPDGRAVDDDRDRSRSRSRHRYLNRNESDRTRRRASHYHSSPDRAPRRQRDASPRSSRRSSLYEKSGSSLEDSYYRERNYGEKKGAPLKRTYLTKVTRRYPSPSRDTRRPPREPSPSRYPLYRRGSYYSGSSASSPMDSVNGDSRSRYDRQGHKSEDYFGDGHRGGRRH